MLDFLISNVYAFDPSEDGAGRVRDIAVRDGRIVEPVAGEDALHFIDAKGCIAMPGLCDLHAHFVGAGGICISGPDMLLSSGVTAVCDAGTAGCLGYAANRYARSAIHTRAFLLVNGEGQRPGLNEDPDPAKYDLGAIRALFEEYPNELIGLKLRLSRDIVGEFGIAPLDASVELAGKLAVPLCVHVTDAPCRAGEIANRLRAGDVFCHMYHGIGNTILDGDGRVQKEMFAARERGVIFDMANGRMNFSFGVAKAAMEQGFLPDVISTDMTADKQFTSPYAKDMPSVISKMIALGMPRDKAFKAATSAPYRIAGLGEASLKNGSAADIAIMRETDTDITMRDCLGESVAVRKLFIPQTTLLGGKIVYCYGGFGN